MSTVFLDTVGLLAQWDKTDQWHEAASEALRKIVSRRDRLVTTTFVLMECGNAAARRPYRAFTAQTCAEMSSNGCLVFPTEQDWEMAWVAYARGDSAAAGMVDQISFVVLRRLGIADVFTNDRHFKSAGFNILF